MYVYIYIYICVCVCVCVCVYSILVLAGYGKTLFVSYRVPVFVWLFFVCTCRRYSQLGFCISLQAVPWSLRRRRWSFCIRLVVWVYSSVSVRLGLRRVVHWAEITLRQHLHRPSQCFVLIKQSDTPCPRQF